MNKFIKFLLLGFMVGLIFFIGPGLLTGNGGLLGYDFFPNFLSQNTFGLIIIGFIYGFLGALILGLLLMLLKKGENGLIVIKNAGIFGFGILISYGIFWLVAAWAISGFQAL